MRFLFISLLCLASPLMELPSVLGDLRAASQPRNNFQTRQRNANVPFQSKTVIYMEPSDFQYAGLRQQRDGGAYDNFLRSNIDNEQDKRNFNNEAGRDMLPFRSFEGAPTDASNTVQTKIPDGAPGPVITAAPGEKVLYPLRWNNPHASELEVNIWIMNVPNSPVVVPIRRPTCSGEGHQDNVISFTVPTNFNDLGASIPGFTGCKKEGDCVLQVYAHSVEPRTYAIGVPIVVTGTVTPATATGTDAIQPAKQDVGLDLSKLTHDICLPSSDPTADITVAVPRAARLVSDVFNHAYQNSDYSPYSGQQPEAISQNLQASAIISMIPANQGELGKALLQQQKPQVAAFAANLRNKVQALVQKYEGIVNKIIAQVGDKTMTNTATVGTNGVQKLATCFRCAEVGAITPTRLTTSTYVPSFAVPPAQLAAVKALVPGQYSGLISAAGNVQIYQAVLNDLAGEFTKAAGMGLLYQPAVIKATTTTMADATQFKKRNAAGQTDNGIYAASKAAAIKLASAKAVSQEMAKATGDTPVSKLAALAASDSFILPESLAASTEYMVDMDGVNTDASCDNDAQPSEQCQGAKPLFAQAADGSGLAIEQEGAAQGSSSSTVSIPVIAAIVGGVGLVAIILAAVIVKQRHAKKHTVTRANTHKETHISHFQPQPTHNNFTHNIEMDNTTRV